MTDHDQQVPLPPGAKMPPRVVRTKWGTDPYFHGSYSYMRLRPEDKELTGEAVDALGEPLCNDEGGWPAWGVGSTGARSGLVPAWCRPRCHG